MGIYIEILVKYGLFSNAWHFVGRTCISILSFRLLNPQLLKRLFQEPPIPPGTFSERPRRGSFRVDDGCSPGARLQAKAALAKWKQMPSEAKRDCAWRLSPYAFLDAAKRSGFLVECVLDGSVLLGVF